MWQLSVGVDVHLEKEVEALKEHPVEAGEVEEVGEGEGGAEERLDEPQRHQVLPREGEDPVECGETKSAEQPHVDLVTQAAHLPGGGKNYPSCQAGQDNSLGGKNYTMCQLQ